MYSLRGYGGNHLGMFAGTRSDFIITQHPEFHLGRLASEQGLGQQWDTTRCACKTSRSWVMQKIHDSMLNSSERLCGPRAQGVSLKQRALARSASAPGRALPEVNVDAETSFDDLRKAMKVHALRCKHGHAVTMPHTSFHQRPLRHPQGLGRYNYTVPSQALPFIEHFNPPMQEVPLLPKAVRLGKNSACAP
ncbi:unnamed protein product [Durusdinium trenchii]|uniref:Uncharacterized protein n=1 Tax=Durusdinium trenchii TaxID=1381693 RepID=A0ABP0SX57_9DINO